MLSINKRLFIIFLKVDLKWLKFLVYMPYVGPREAWSVGMNQFFFLIKVVRRTLLSLCKSLNSSDSIFPVVFCFFVCFKFILHCEPEQWCSSTLFLLILIKTRFFSYIFYQVSFSYIDLLLDSECHFCILADLRLIILFDKLFLSNQPWHTIL